MRFWELVFGRRRHNKKPAELATQNDAAAPSKTAETEEQAESWGKQWTQEMVLRISGNGPKVYYYTSSYSTCKIQWVSKKQTSLGEPVQVRDPEEQTTEYPKNTGFTAAGRKYISLRQLTAEAEEGSSWCRDCYGREVFCVKERFPCFDSYDYLHENRHYRWFFLRENGKLTRVHYADGQNSIYVTEDVLYLETNCWDEIKKLEYFTEQGI